MSDRLPLFPLGAVLFPGLVLPLRVFEQRYRDLVRDLSALPQEQRRFGVVAIREGHEVGAGGATALHPVGCTAAVRQQQEHPDGTYDLVTVGADRFRLEGLHTDRSYLVGEVSFLPDGIGDAAEAAVLDPAVRAAFAAYLAALGGAGGGTLELPDLPDDPLVLSHLVAATVQVELSDRQALLEADDGRDRLRAELRLLRRETGLLQQLRAIPSSVFVHQAASPH